MLPDASSSSLHRLREAFSDTMAACPPLAVAISSSSSSNSWLGLGRQRLRGCQGHCRRRHQARRSRQSRASSSTARCARPAFLGCSWSGRWLTSRLAWPDEARGLPSSHSRSSLFRLARLPSSPPASLRCAPLARHGLRNLPPPPRRSSAGPCRTSGSGCWWASARPAALGLPGQHACLLGLSMLLAGVEPDAAAACRAWGSGSTPPPSRQKSWTFTSCTL